MQINASHSWHRDVVHVLYSRSHSDNSLALGALEPRSGRARASSVAAMSRQAMLSNMEDSGTLTALRRLAQAGKTDFERVLVLRTASNYSMQPKDKAASWSATAPYPENGRPALEAS